MAYTVSAPLVITKRADGSDLYLYQGAPFPESDSDEVKRLEDEGFIEKVAPKALTAAEKKAAEAAAKAEADAKAEAEKKAAADAAAAQGN